MGKSEVCSEFCVDVPRIEKVRKSMKDDNTFFLLAETFKAMADPTRLKLLYALSLEELCVCELNELLGMTQSAVSHQLRVLRNMRLVKCRKSGRSVFYSLDDEHITNLFHEGLEHVGEEAGKE